MKVSLSKKIHTTFKLVVLATLLALFAGVEIEEMFLIHGTNMEVTTETESNVKNEIEFIYSGRTVSVKKNFQYSNFVKPHFLYLVKNPFSQQVFLKTARVIKYCSFLI